MANEQKLIYACPWKKDKIKSWSGTYWNLRQSLGRYYSVVDVDTGFSDNKRILSLSYKVLKKVCQVSGSSTLLPVKAQKALIERRLEPAIRQAPYPMLQFEYMPSVENGRNQYLYIDLHYGYVKKMFEEEPGLFKVSGYSYLPKRLIDCNEYGQRMFMQEGTAVFTMGKWLKKELTQQYGIGQNKVFHAGGGINLDPDRIDTSGKKRNKILFVGRDFERKNGPLVVEAFKRLCRKRPDARLYIAGPKNLGLCGSNIYVLGDVPGDKLAEYFNLCDIFCMPSLFEAYGLVFAEALAFGLPCIGRNAFEMPYFIDEGNTGYLLRSQSADELAGLMERLLGDEAVFANVKDNREYYLNEYSWDNVAARIWRVISHGTADAQGEQQ